MIYFAYYLGIGVIASCIYVVLLSTIGAFSHFDDMVAVLSFLCLLTWPVFVPLAILYWLHKFLFHFIRISLDEYDKRRNRNEMDN